MGLLCVVHFVTAQELGVSIKNGQIPSVVGWGGEIGTQRGNRERERERETASFDPTVGRPAPASTLRGERGRQRFSLLCAVPVGWASYMDRCQGTSLVVVAVCRLFHCVLCPDFSERGGFFLWTRFSAWQTMPFLGGGGVGVCACTC